MNRLYIILTTAVFFIALHSHAQGGWSNCNVPPLGNRVDDVFMVDAYTGYAACGDGQILKSTDGGDNWYPVSQNTAIYCRSVEFIDSLKGFVGGFPFQHTPTPGILRMTTDGGATWNDLTPLLDPRGRAGICGLTIPDSNTIYGCGNFFQDSAYIVKSVDGGATWSFIDMHVYATHLIDMFFLNPDTGFAVGTGPLPAQHGIVLYTTDGGMNWTYNFQDTAVLLFQYCWKIQHLTDQIYFAALQGNLPTAGRILKSVDGGMNWTILYTPAPLSGNGIQGVGFLDSLKGWTGGGFASSYESNDGGLTWDTVNICPAMNRVFRVNDSLVFATGMGIWKYNSMATAITHPFLEAQSYATVKCFPNPANKNLTISISLLKSTRAMLLLLDASGRKIKTIENTNKSRGDYVYPINTSQLSAGVYYVLLKTYEDDVVFKVVIQK